MKQVKSGNFNWFYRQLYYALNNNSTKCEIDSDGTILIVRYRIFYCFEFVFRAEAEISYSLF
jgi:hypothetical protein